MMLDVEHARTRLEEIFALLEQADSDDDTFDYQILDEMHSLARFLQKNSLAIRSVRRGQKLVVELEPIGTLESLAA